MDHSFSRSESHILVFISSVMTDDLKCARKLAEQAVRTYPITSSWTFEYTPASSRPPADEYLRKVEEADFVIWLVGSETSRPVFEEITTCISTGGRLLAFKLPAPRRDNQTCKLLQYISPHTKWKEVASIEELPGHITSALSDELTKALRDPTPPLRRSRLKHDRRLSVSRCKQSWITLGVPDDLANDLSDDQSVGDVLVEPNPGMYMVTGDQGSGKSLAIERLFQQLVKDALADSSRPFPLFVNARDLDEPLSDYIDRMSHGYAQPSIHGASILIDGLDEIGVSAANDLLRQASTYTDANSNATAVVTSRSLPGLNKAGNQIAIPMMDDDNVISLINRISGRSSDMRLRYGWSGSTWDAAKRPLFAVMIGSELRRNPDSGVPRPSQLVDQLAQRLRQEAGGDPETTDELLQALAVKAINSGTRVNLSDVIPRLARQRIIGDSRLVTQHGNTVDFTLAIFREWYAARALIEGTVSVNEIASASDRWTIPLEIVLESGSEDLGRSLMTRLAASDPGLASQLLQDAEPRWPYHETDEPSLGTAVEVGEEIRNTMEIWGQGLGDLYSVIGPVDGNGNTATLGIRLDGDYVTTSWYSGSEALPAVLELPENIDWHSVTLDWPTLLARGIPPGKTWPWVLTKDYLADSLARMIGSRNLALESIDGVRELSWAFACGITNQGSFNPRPIVILDVVRHIDEMNICEHDSFVLCTMEGTFSDKEILIVKQHLLGLMAAGENLITESWPSADQLRPTGYVWESYGPQQLLHRTCEVYAGALRIYTAMVDQWFTAFGARLRLYRLLPVRLEGRLELPSQGDREPVISWCTRCLPEDSESTVAFAVGERRELPDFRSYWSDEAKALRQLRQGHGAVPSPFYVSEILPVWKSRPATELAHSWLVDELRELGWNGR